MCNAHVAPLRHHFARLHRRVTPPKKTPSKPVGESRSLTHRNPSRCRLLLRLRWGVVTGGRKSVGAGEGLRRRASSRNSGFYARADVLLMVRTTSGWSREYAYPRNVRVYILVS